MSGDRNHAFWYRPEAVNLNGDKRPLPTFYQARAKAEKAYLRKLEREEPIISKAASIAGLGRQRLHELRTKYGLTKPRPRHRGVWNGL